MIVYIATRHWSGDNQAAANPPKCNGTPVYCVCISGLFRKMLFSVNMYSKMLIITVIMN